MDHDDGSLIEISKAKKTYGKGYLVLCCFLCLSGGLIVVFFGGVASTEKGLSFLEDMFRVERRAEVKNKQSFTRPRFQFDYPGNWKLNTTREGHDPDTNFFFDSPGNSYVHFIVSPEEYDPQENIDDKYQNYLQYMPTMKTKSLSGYGKYGGKGLSMRGRFFGFATTINVYSFYHEGLTFIIVEQCTDEDFKMVSPGFSLIEKSLRIKKE